MTQHGNSGSWSGIPEDQHGGPDSQPGNSGGQPGNPDGQLSSPEVQPSSSEAQHNSFAGQHRIGYVLKVYPRFSETFIVTEILAREAQGEQVEIFALRHSTDPRFHPELARVQAPLTYVPRPFKASEAWEVMARAQRIIPDFGLRLARLLPDLAETEASEVHQGIELACSVVYRGITHLHCHFANLSVKVAEIASRLTGVPYSVTTHAKDLFHESVSHPRLERTFRHADHVVTISRYNRCFLSSNFQIFRSVAGQKVHLVYNGLELSRFPYAAPSNPSGPLHVVGVGRLVEKKGFDVLIRAAAVAHRAGLEVRVTIAGGGERDQQLKELVSEVGLADRIEFQGPRTQREVGELLRQADVFVAPCVVGADGNADGLPTVLLEAMAMGVPVIATRVTGIPEVIRGGDADGSGQTGILLEPGVVESLAQALTTVADPRWDRATVTRAAREVVETHFDSQHQAAALRALLPPVPTQLPPVPDVSSTSSDAPMSGPTQRAGVQ
ncbi:glycosyltransferase family 4 protein [Kocuria sp.]|uniref:glycosyltransferase family 4 protein n=1 Tax=Kocuria sp. TaxID=1871328 RepID=UPI0026DEC31A|nr:glycosyltransferase family 4 protein [Kocuria sp.]MDO5617445.1 glycosyltransferase family 4 protein [Kocuria sp.]